jgi:chromosome partitioning protein
MKIISIANQKGGCGKTTTAINLASALSINGKRVLLIDLDPQAHASLGLDIESQDSIYNVISRLTPRKLKLDNIVKKISGFDVVPSNILVGTLEQELADEIGRELKLVEILSPLKDRYDYILIDCAPSLGILTVNAIRVSDEMLIPVETSRFSMHGVDHLLDIVSLVRDRLNHDVKCRVLITMFDSRLRHSFAMLSTFKERFKTYLLDTIVHVNVKLKESAVMGKPVSEYDKYCRGSKDYNSLAKEMIMYHEGRVPESIKKEESTILKAVKKDLPAFSQEDIDKANQEIKEAIMAQQTESPQEETVEQAEEIIETITVRLNNEDQVRIDKLEERLETDFQTLSGKMQEIVQEEISDMFSVRFTIEDPNARSVYVTGSFNDWSLDDNCRLKRTGNVWETTLPLRPGVYKYQFIVDGVWREDPQNPNKERNSFGDVNSLIEVKTA